MIHYQLELHQLKAFVTVAKYLNITDAAHELHVAQPALSKKLKILEYNLGVNLIDRRRHSRVALTSIGKRFLVDAKRIVGACDKAIYEIRRMNKEIEYGKRERWSASQRFILQSRESIRTEISY